MTFVADAGERNRVVLTEERGRSSYQLGPGQWLVHDPGAVLRAGNACASVDEHTVRCTATSSTMIGGYRLALGDQDDRLEVLPTATLDPEDLWVVANGGPGDDVLHGGDTEYVLGDRLRGGGGEDALHGHGGPDILIDGDRPGATGSDQLDGGPGADVVSYQGRDTPVSVDLADPSPDGARGEGDVITEVESITGGRRGDRLTGDAGRNVLDGQGGRDRLSGGGGDDAFVRGGATINCGRGEDRTWAGRGRARITEGEFLLPGCETIEPRFDLRFDVYPTAVGRRSLSYLMRCPPRFSDDEEVASSCEGTLRFRDVRRRVLASASFSVNAEAPVRARLTPLGRRLTGRSGGVVARVHIASPEIGGDLTGWDIRLRRTR